MYKIWSKLQPRRILSSDCSTSAFKETETDNYREKRWEMSTHVQSKAWSDYQTTGKYNIHDIYLVS